VITSDEREKLCKSAVRLCKSAGYYSAGTVEFLMGSDKQFYLMEVNTRVQVEHPVTEMVTGIDIVKEQLSIAAGEKLSFTQKQVKQKGHAIEVRINAEDPARNFAPCAGTIEHFDAPGGPGVRIDTHCHSGYRIPPNYDSMIAKLIVHQPTRDQAIATLKRALNEFTIDPIKTTAPLFQRILKLDAFVNGGVDTGYIDRTFNTVPAAAETVAS